MPLPIQLPTLLFAMTSRDETILDWYLDLRTGGIEALFDPVVSGKTNEDIERRMDLDPGRYAKIPPFNREYRLMMRFAEQIEEDELALRLDIALRGQSAFRSFHAVISGERDAREAWSQFREQALTRWALDWLEGLGVEHDCEPALDEPTAAAIEESETLPPIGLVEMLLLGNAGHIDDQGRHGAFIPASTPREALGLFRRIVAELCDLLGEPRVRPTRRETQFVRGAYSLERSDEGIQLWVRVEPSAVRRFSS